MTEVDQKIQLVREAGEIGLELLECNTPPVSRYAPEGDDGVPIFQEDERFWSAWTQARDLAAKFDDDPTIEEVRDDSVPHFAIHTRRRIDGERFANVGFVYGADGKCVINLEFKIEDGWRAINDYQKDLTALDIGRQIAAVELAVLANELQSPAETMDYWMTQTLYSIRQSSWADDRKASPQTVSDRVRSAKEKLDFEET